MTDDLESATKRLAELVGATDELQSDHDASLVRLIRVRRRVGDGSIDSPNRVVTTLHTLDGQLVHTEDPEQSSDDPRVELLQSALHEALRSWSQELNNREDHLTPSEIEHMQKRIAKLEKLTDPEWRP